MQINAFEWDEHNSWKPCAHGIEIEEVEAIFFNQPLLLRTHSGRYLALGRTDEGHYLTVVFENKGKGVIRPITARDMNPAERKYYQNRR